MICPRFGSSLKTGGGVESGLAQLRREIDRSLDGGEAVIGDDQNICGIACILFRDRIEDEGKVSIGTGNRCQRWLGARSEFVLRNIGIAEPKERKGGQTVAPHDFREGAGSVGITLVAGILRPR